MANLASIIMEGATFGSGISTKLSHSYDHENGATLIAMESAEALRDIFETTFYVPNTCEIAATLEGASCVEESSQMVIMENAFKSAFAKVKEFLVKLKNKVIELLHSIKRYLDGIFKSDQDWVKKYKEDLRSLKSGDLKDYEVKMYKYTNLEHTADLQGKMDGFMDDIIGLINNGIENMKNDTKEEDTDDIDEEISEMYKSYVKSALNADPDDDDDIDEKIFGRYRDGATGESDKDTVSVAGNMSTFISALEKSNKELSAYDKEISSTNKAYEKTIKYIDNVEKRVDKLNISEGQTGSVTTTGVYKNAKFDKDGKYAGFEYSRNNGTGHAAADQTPTISTTQAQSNITANLRALSSTVSKMQTVNNKIFTAKKSAYVERNAAYKKALMGAFAYARKNKKK